MSTEYSYTCDRCFQKAPGQAVFNTAKGARNWAPEGWMAVRINRTPSGPTYTSAPTAGRNSAPRSTTFCQKGKP